MDQEGLTEKTNPVIADIIDLDHKDNKYCTANISIFANNIMFIF